MVSSGASTDGRVIRWAGHRDRRRSEFVDIALATIAAHGPDTTIEQIAARAGVTRTKLYRFFDGAADLRQAVARRTAEALTAELAPVWNPDGSPLQMITASVNAHVRWLADNSNLYIYLDRHAQSGDPGAAGAINDVKYALGTHLATVFAAHMTAFGIDPTPAQPLGFGVIGFVESATRRWVQDPGDYSEGELIEQLSQWIWQLLDGTLQAGGITIDPHSRLEQPPSLTSRAAPPIPTTHA